MEPANKINGSMTITISFPKSYPRSEDLPDTFNIESKDHYQLFQKRKPYISGVIHITVGMLTLCLGLVFLRSDNIVFPFLSLFNILSVLNGGLAICSSVVQKTCVVKWFIIINICNLLWSASAFVGTTMIAQSKHPVFTGICALCAVSHGLELINCLVSCWTACKAVCLDDFNTMPLVYLEYPS